MLYHTVGLHFLRCPSRLGQIDFFGDLELLCAIPKYMCVSFVCSVKGSEAVGSGGAPCKEGMSTGTRPTWSSASAPL